MRPTPPYTIGPLGPNHDRAAFFCGEPALDLYIQRQARQDQERNLSAVFILTQNGSTIDGFYTLSALSILATDLPETQARKLPRRLLTATLLGRMAISKVFQGHGLGEILLMNALERAHLGSQQIASWGVLVDAKIGARAFYVKHEFAPLTTQPDRLFLPMKTIEKLFNQHASSTQTAEPAPA